MYSLSNVPSLVASLVVPIHPEQTLRLQRIDEEDYSGTARKTLEHFVEKGCFLPPGYIERGVYALKQYYAVALLDPANAHAVSRAVDPFWHEHMLHSEQYVRFCDEVMGEYMHHRPLNHEIQEHVQVIRRLYDYTLEVLPKLFHTVDTHFWTTIVSDDELICWHKGNQDIYLEVQAYRLFSPTPKGVGYAF